MRELIGLLMRLACDRQTIAVDKPTDAIEVLKLTFV